MPSRLLMPELLLMPQPSYEQPNLCEMSKHSRQGLPADSVRLILASSVATDGRELPDSLQQSPVGVAFVSQREQVVEIFLGKDVLDPLDIVRVGGQPHVNLLHHVAVQGLHRLFHLIKEWILFSQQLLSLQCFFVRRNIAEGITRDICHRWSLVLLALTGFATS